MPYGTVNAEQMTTQSGFTLGAGDSSSFKNKIINGAMTVDQRYAGTVYSPANGFSVDRWTSGYYAPAGGTYSAQQVVDAPAGFYNSLKMTVTATPSNNTDAFFQLYQPIEANNVADFALGTASAKSFTFSFWVKSSLTGTFCVAFGNNTSPAYYYISTYTINTANTWEFKTISVTAPTAGTWGTTNGQGLAVFFDLGSGTNQDAPTANTWNAGNYRRVSSGVRLIGTNGATLNVTGCQLEVGTVATSFDYRPYGTELMLCQRYLPAFTNGGTNGYLGPVFIYSATGGIGIIPFQVPARVRPTGVTINSLDLMVDGIANYNVSAAIYASSTPTAGCLNLTFSGATAGQAGGLLCEGSTNILFTGCEL